jgi:hypothetical protein
MFNLFKSDWKKGFFKEEGKIRPIKYKIVNGHAIVQSPVGELVEGSHDGRIYVPFHTIYWWPEFNDSEFVNWKENAISLEKRAKE